MDGLLIMGFKEKWTLEMTKTIMNQVTTLNVLNQMAILQNESHHGDRNLSRKQQ